VDDGEQPSRFLGELGVTVTHVKGRPARPLSLAGLVSELRRTVTDPDTSPPLRDAAARRLARLRGERVGPRQLVPQADPATWWGTRSASTSTRPVRDPERPVPVSASVLDSVMVCPAQWFLRDEAGGVERAHQEANVGQLVHALAERVASGELTSGPGDVDELMTHVDAVWDRLHFRTPWSKAREHARVRRALTRFLEWHYGDKRELVDVESRFSTVVDLPDGEQVELTGYADRIERDADGRLVVVDLKTGRSMPTNKSVQTHRQLGLYQYAVDSGALDEKVDDGEHHVAGGAELVQLGSLDDGPAVVQEQPAVADDGPEREALRAELGMAAQMVRAEVFPAVPSQVCRDCAFVPICPAKSAGSVLSQ
jgi:CRISPR/Cas system-associated exonuclease Cas4 (RecB family)